MLICPVTGDCVVDVLASIDPSLLKQNVLNHGFVNVVDVMPRLVPADHPTCDFSLAEAARLSYQKGTKKVSNDAGLIDNLIRNQHTSPIEMGELKYHMRMPIFVMRQLVRHRTASLNEESARYSVLDSDFYIPRQEDWAANTAANKQATVRGAVTDPDLANFLYDRITNHNAVAYQLYLLLLGDRDDDQVNDEEADYWNKLGVPAVAREQARMVLGTNIYTSCYWKSDLKNLLHLLRLRTDAHAQWEIREYGDAMARVVQACFPVAFKSFKDNFIDGVNFSKVELDVVGSVFVAIGGGIFSIPANHMVAVGWTQRRTDEFTKKLMKTGWVSPEGAAKLTEAIRIAYAK